MIPYSFHPEAEAEFAEAALFYESRLVGLGKLFASEVDETISLIRKYPDVGSPVGYLRRRMLVRGFPYSVVYRRDPDFILIIAVAHSGRRPRYWRHRK
ncbi:MAG: type II toxin-antitoxin system RelE/ParE family toxin [Gammaproteobacteria bacterium]